MEENHSEEERENTIKMPAPTFWPMVLAFGITLLAAGLVTNIAVSIIGIVILLRAAFGWWPKVIPHEEHEFVERRYPEERAVPVRVSSRSVATLRVGVGHHRMRIPEKVHPYTAGLWGGLAGGAAMGGLACAYGIFAQHSIWYPINLLAAMIIPSMANSTVEGLRAFNPVAFGIAFVAHSVISILVGVLYAVTLPMFPRGAPIWAGFVVPLFWSGLLAATLNLTNPALNERVNWVWFVICQIGFGAVAGFVAAKTQRIDTMQNLPFLERAAIEGQFGERGSEEENR
ncbi:MAG: hypothetical protein WAM39_28990 [Bryobacteraceae bacterium]